MKSNTPENPDDAGLKERIAQLTLRLHSEVAKVNSSHQRNLEALALDCSKAMKELSEEFNLRLQESEKKHRESIVLIEEKIAYLTELSDSQHLMLQHSIEYIKELEKPPQQPSTPE